MFHLRCLPLIVALLALTVANGQELTATISAVDHDGYHITCFGAKDGEVTVTVTGGQPPYSIGWSTGDETATVTGLASGYIKVKVSDANSNATDADITLKEPEPMKLELTPFKYPSGLNISCYECYNGSVDLEVHGGVAPFTYLWNDDITTQDRTGLGALAYDVQVIDANGCREGAKVKLEQPEKATWGMEGNTNTDPGTHFIGTNDAQDVVFKSNGTEMLRLKSNGDFSLLGSFTGEGPLFRMEDGTLRGGGGFPEYPELPPERCRYLGAYPYWETRGNAFAQLCPEEVPLLGTLSEIPLKIVTSGVERMRIDEDGTVSIGAMAVPETKLNVQGDLLVRGGSHGDIVTRSSETEGVVVWARNNLAAWGLSIDPEGKGHILGDWNNPHPVMTFAYDKVGIGTEEMPGSDYNLFVSKGILTEKLKVNLVMNWPDYVFHPEYKLLPLKDVAAFVQEHGHLPGVPSANEMEESGLDVVKTDALLLEKIEEITLHLIALEARVGELEVENAGLKRNLFPIENTTGR